MSINASLHLGILGAGGRMGRMVASLLREEYADRVKRVTAVGRGEGVAPLAETDAIIDFSTPEATLSLLEGARQKHLPPLACGTTGWTDAQRQRLDAQLAYHCVLMAANFSTGILVLRQMLEQHGPLLRRLGFTPVMTETHHRHKKDAPSGTALALNRAVDPVHPEAIQTHATRAGEVIGEHQLTFYGPEERLILGHIAQDRALFARGAIEVALWLARLPKATGRLGMDDYFRALNEAEL